MIVAAPAALATLKGGRGECKHCGEFYNNVALHESIECEKRVIGAPQWLKDRMKALKKLPPPTLEEVRQQWKASADWEYNHRYDDIWSIDSEGRKVIR